MGPNNAFKRKPVRCAASAPLNAGVSSKLIWNVHDELYQHHCPFPAGLKRPSKESNIRLLHERGETPRSFVIREAHFDDIPELAILHVKTWNETYRNVNNPPTVQIRENQWREQFKVTDGSWFCFVVENPKGELVGFAKGKAFSHSDRPDFSGELNKIYLLSHYQRIGLGRHLVCHVVRRFLSEGVSAMVLFAVPQNPSCWFFEALGVRGYWQRTADFTALTAGRICRILQQPVPMNKVPEIE